MSISLPEAEIAHEKFIQEYWANFPYGNCITSVGVSVVVGMDKSLPVAEHTDFCLVVGIHTPLPPGISFPSHYLGVRVFVEKAEIPIVY